MYLIFGGKCYYAAGGGNDFISSNFNRNLAISYAKSLEGGSVDTKRKPHYDGENDEDLVDSYDIEWVHVLCTETHKVIYRSENHPFGDNTKHKEIESVRFNLKGN